MYYTGDLNPEQEGIQDRVDYNMHNVLPRVEPAALPTTGDMDTLIVFVKRNCLPGADGIASEHLVFGTSGILCHHLASFIQVY